jgi:hypothetical protein
MELRDLIFPVLMGLAFIFMIANIGAVFHKYIFDERLLENCTQKKEFIILEKIVVKCEIIKDLR